MRKGDKTTHVRIYSNDLMEIKTKFPDIKMADFFRISIRTNPFVQVEAALRKRKNKNV